TMILPFAPGGAGSAGNRGAAVHDTTADRVTSNATRRGTDTRATIYPHAMPDQLCLMAVHAHPDDEAISTGGVLARYSDEGSRTVLVTCTDGALGDFEGIKPDQEGHDAAATVEIRRNELEQSVAHLGIDHLEMLGYADSGMMGWPQNEAPHAFWNTPVDVAA